ncbi:MAG: hypothetical protein WCN95_11325 [bacterium]
MTIGEKWSSLFHHTIQSESTLSPELAHDALVLVEWMVEQWRRELVAEGYEAPAGLESEIEAVCDALRWKSKNVQGTPPVGWPASTLYRWERNKPFHPSIGKLLSSSWEALLAVKATAQEDTTRHNIEQRDTVWVVAGSQSLRRAWEKVLRCLLPDGRWQLVGLSTVAELPGRSGNPMAKNVIVFGSPWDAEGQRAAFEQRCAGKGSLNMIAVNTTDVSAVLMAVAKA